MNIEKNTDAVASEADQALRSTFGGLESWERLLVVAIIIVGTFTVSYTHLTLPTKRIV